MNTDFYVLAALFLLANIAIGLVRFSFGPGPVDRLLSIQLFSTTVVAMVLLLAAGLDSNAIIDIALLMALLAPVAVITFVRHSGHHFVVAKQKNADHDK
jgi:multicomponent Na+:H+ antiporter subunit F